LALLNWQMRIFRLCHRSHEHIQTTRIHPLSSEATQLAVHTLRAAPAKLTHRLDAEQLKVLEHRWTN
jgi:hypothetical protein